MPVIEPSSYLPPPFLKNRHAQTIIPAVARTVRGVAYRRERLDLRDGDFIDVDWLDAPSRRLVVLLHGLEGNSQRSYIKGMAKAFRTRGWSAMAVNFRGCSGEPNRLLRSYHAGATDDLRDVLRRAIALGKYDHIGLIGFSLGGNLLLKYLGEESQELLPAILGAVAFSVPCDLASSVEAISRPENRLYMNNFLKQLRKKLEQKQARFPDEIKLTGFEDMTTFYEFDDRYTAPIHGFENATEYWRLNSCQRVLHRITVPTLIVNARDDPFLGESCFPRRAARKNPSLGLEIPSHGGHVGFIQLNRHGRYWSENRALEFLMGRLGLLLGVENLASNGGNSSTSLSACEGK